MRFAHARAYVDSTAREAGFVPLVIRSASTRREAGIESPGLICVLGVPVRAARVPRRPADGVGAGWL
jgi:predicted TPR repeat methyltransferase